VGYGLGALGQIPSRLAMMAAMLAGIVFLDRVIKAPLPPTAPPTSTRVKTRFPLELAADTPCCGVRLGGAALGMVMCWSLLDILTAVGSLVVPFYGSPPGVPN
jgi:hypothetical protein